MTIDEKVAELRAEAFRCFREAKVALEEEKSKLLEQAKWAMDMADKLDRSIKFY